MQFKATIDGVGFSERAHYYCTEQALEVTLRHFGYELEDVLYDEWRFVYARPQNAEEGFLVAAGPPVNFASKFRAFGLKLEFRRTQAPEEALARIAWRVQVGEPVPVWVDSYFLPYYWSQEPRHSEHAVVVVGVDAEGVTVRIVDPSPWQRYAGDLEVSSLKAALSSEFLDARQRNSWIQIEYPDRSPQLTRTRVQESLVGNLQAMSEPGVPRRVKTAKGEGVLFEGLAGIRRLARDIGEWAELDADRIREYTGSARSQLADVARRRYGHARYLISAGDRFGDEEMRMVGVKLEKLAEAWFLPGNMLFKAGVRGAADLVRRAAGRLDDLADREQELLRRLASGSSRAGCPTDRRSSPRREGSCKELG